TAEIGAGTVIEPRVVIAAGVKIGKNCRIMTGAVIENDTTIGDGSMIHPQVVVGYGSKLGREVVIEAGSVIGSAGFGFAQDQKRKSHTIPQTGIVVLEDRVRVGANCCIDRATYHETRIGAGTKLDNLCHVAHNVQIGEDCLLTAMFCVAGSTTIGNRVMASGQTGIIDHMNVCDDAVLLHRAGVTKDVEKPGAYAGLPVQPLTDYMKNVAAMKSASEIRTRLIHVEKRLGVHDG
ncbi:MAG: UDP-3-O-(3-hydroxymyristoyl)glucosamine N-acyltransferase, partial [Bdellovibrionota bacterium]